MLLPAMTQVKLLQLHLNDSGSTGQSCRSGLKSNRMGFPFERSS